MNHVAIDKLFTLDGGFAGTDGRRHTKIPGTRRLDKMGHRDWTPGYPVGDVAAINLPRDAPSRAP